MTSPQPETDHDSIIAAYEEISLRADALCGDVVLIPDAGHLDGLTRDALTKLSHWSTTDENDKPLLDEFSAMRLAVLTDGIFRFIDDGKDASLVTVWRGGKPIVRQIDGEPCQAAIDLISNAAASGEVLQEKWVGLPPLEAECAMIDHDHGFSAGNRPKWVEREAQRRLALREQQRADFAGKPAASNDNEPVEDRLRRAFVGGTMHFSAEHQRHFIARCIKDGKIGNGMLDDSGEPVFEAYGAPERPKLNLVNPAQWHGKPTPTRDWYIPDLIPARQVTIISGDGGTGKSLLKLQIGAAGAMGIDTLGLSPAQGRVLYLGAEDEEDEFHRRLADIVHGHGRTLADLADFRLLPMAGEDALLSVPDRSGIMQPTPLWSQFADAARDFQPRLVVLDTVADLFGGDEIKRGQARQFIGILRKLAMEIDCAVVLLAHPSQQGISTGSGRSGSTGWSNSSRGMLYLTRPEGADADPDVRVLSTKKANYGAAGGEMRLRWHEGHFILDSNKSSAGSVLVAAKAERVFVDMLSMLNRQGRNVCHVPGTTYAPAVMAKLPEAEGLSKALLGDAMNRLLRAGDVKIVKEGPPSRERQKLILEREDFGSSD